MSTITLEQQHATLHYSPSDDLTAVEIDGRQWTLTERPLRWFERRESWWTVPGLRVQKGTGKGIVDVETLRVECRLGRNPRSQTTTFDLQRQVDGTWLVRDVLRAA